MTMRVLLALLLLALAAPLAAQGPEADWRTLETAHYRVHYPAPAEAWARRAASKLEAVRERVAHEVGYAPTEVTDVLVVDPVASANGIAWPILGSPRLVLYTTPPGPDSVIGHYRDWGELLLTHEDAHLAHLLRRSRNPWRRLGERLLPVGPIPLEAPRWLIEGYATYLEGRLTGSGRPNGDLRATVLRRWAQRGELPSYGRLSTDSRSWLGMSMAYLAGSAYLEWLVEREGPESLRSLWARLTARRSRSFDDAFRGVFGEAPATLYNRFRAELTYRAMGLEELVEPHLREGELWQDLAWSTGPPALSPTGDRLAIVLRSRRGPSRLVVWSTAPDEAAEREWREAAERLLERDPEDAPAVRAGPLRREPLHELVSRRGGEPHTPRWSGDGRSLLYVAYEADARGFLHPDLFRWTPETGRVERLTAAADLRDPDPAPGGGWAVAVRHRHGRSQLVRVELVSARVEPLTEAEVDVVYDHPRLSPEGDRLAYVRHRDGAWKLVVRRLADGRENVLPTPEGATVAYPAWSADGRELFAAIGEDGMIDLRRFPAGGEGEPRQVTRSHGAALAPAPTPDGRALFYLGLESDGLDLRRLELEAAAPPPSRLALGAPPASFAPALRPEPPPHQPYAEAEVGEGRPYGLGRQELQPLLAGRAAPSARGFELGLRGGDVVGRLEWLALGAVVDGGAEGGAAAVAWRGWPLELRAHLAAARERLSEQPTEVPGLGTALDLERRGLELRAAYARQGRGARLGLEAGGYLEEVESLGPGPGETLDRELFFLELRPAFHQRFGRWRLVERLEVVAEEGRTEGESWRRLGGEVRLGLARGERVITVAWQRHAARDARHPLDRYQLGGLAGSLLPAAALRGRLHVPALPAATLLGDEHEGQLAELRFGPGGLEAPLRLFYERHRLWPEGGEKGSWLALWGAELSWRAGPLPLLRLPAFELRAGLAHVLDEPFRDDVEAWLGLAWRQ